MKKIIYIIIVVLLVVVLFIGVKITNGKTEIHKVPQESGQVEQKEEKEQEVENLEEILEEEKEYSMHNGDSFAKIGNTILFLINEEIYMQDLESKDFSKLCGTDKIEDGIHKIYFDGEYIYCMPYYYRGKGIYKIDLKGNVEKIYNGASIQLWLTEDKIYFIDQIGFDDINQNPQGNLCIMDKNGENKTILIKDVRNYFKIHGDYIYYLDKNTKGIFRANIDGTNQLELAKGRNFIMSVTDEYIIYIDYSDGEKYRILYFDDNTNKAVGRFGSVKVTKYGTYLFTRKLIGDNDEIELESTLFEIDTETKTEKEILKNDISLDFMIHVYKDYAYFRGERIYRINLKDEKKEKEQLDFSHAYFIDGKAYTYRVKELDVIEIAMYDLNTMEKEILFQK